MQEKRIKSQLSARIFHDMYTQLAVQSLRCTRTFSILGNCQNFPVHIGQQISIYLYIRAVQYIERTWDFYSSALLMCALLLHDINTSVTSIDNDQLHVRAGVVAPETCSLSTKLLALNHSDSGAKNQVKSIFYYTSKTRFDAETRDFFISYTNYSISRWKWKKNFITNNCYFYHFIFISPAIKFVYRINRNLLTKTRF